MEEVLTALSIQLYRCEEWLYGWLANVGKLFVDFSLDVTASVRVLLIRCAIGGLLAI